MHLQIPSAQYGPFCWASWCLHDNVIKWKHFLRNWPFVRGIHRSPVNSPHKGQWRGALMFSLICVGIKDWVNNCEAGDLRRHRANYDVIVMAYARLSGLVERSPPLPGDDVTESPNNDSSFVCPIFKVMELLTSVHNNQDLLACGFVSTWSITMFF